ncbi:phosphatase PAP2 family protein [Pseudogracilibacillus sp. SE30717A]|uniref:phosphatase PAP2 family protein n=1 Tax=Pseudogracilibacillus sp. SE30717A TaxID=3098293 RepID=UPI00300E5D7C
MTSGTQGFLIDETVAYWADQNSNAFILKLMNIASFIGSSEVVLLITVLIGLILLLKRSWRNLFFFFTLSVGGVILNLLLKMLIQRARPGDEVSYIEVFNINLEIQSYSFPSGHTMRATILFLFLIYLTFMYVKNTATKLISYIVYIGLIFAVALSRIMLDAHYVTDIAGAILISISWFFIGLFLFYKPKEASFLTFSR